METILVATDFSNSSDNATNYAVELAKYFNAKIVLVNSFPMPYSSFETGGMPGEMISIMQEASAGGLQNLKKKIEQNNKSDFDIECYSEMGYAEDIIIEVAKKTKADIIVMGITGDGEKTKKHLIGGTAIKVARNTDIPTFIIPNNARYHSIKKISFACNLNQTEESDLISISKYFGKVFNAELEIINVEEPGEGFSEEKSQTCAIMDKKLKTLIHKTVFITEKSTGKALEDYFREHPTDVIMVNPRKHNLFHNLFSHSISKELAFHCKYPLLCIH
ncbi:MAG TPA: universal stress protein [Bacteroidia bacterium]|nr:universal stress protein [Bacteroidia bacterium]